MDCGKKEDYAFDHIDIWSHKSTQILQSQINSKIYPVFIDSNMCQSYVVSNKAAISNLTYFLHRYRDRGLLVLKNVINTNS